MNATRHPLPPLPIRCTLILSEECDEEGDDVRAFTVLKQETVGTTDPTTIRPGDKGCAGCPSCLKAVPPESISVSTETPNHAAHAWWAEHYRKYPKC